MHPKPIYNAMVVHWVILKTLGFCQAMFNNNKGINNTRVCSDGRWNIFFKKHFFLSWHFLLNVFFPKMSKIIFTFWFQFRVNSKLWMPDLSSSHKWFLYVCLQGSCTSVAWQRTCTAICPNWLRPGTGTRAVWPPWTWMGDSPTWSQMPSTGWVRWNEAAMVSGGSNCQSHTVIVSNNF